MIEAELEKAMKMVFKIDKVDNILLPKPVTVLVTEVENGFSARTLELPISATGAEISEALDGVTEQLRRVFYIDKLN